MRVQHVLSCHLIFFAARVLISPHLFEDCFSFFPFPSFYLLPLPTMNIIVPKSFSHHYVSYIVEYLSTSFGSSFFCPYICPSLKYNMVLISDGNSEIGAQVCRDLCHLICLGTYLDREQSQI